MLIALLHLLFQPSQEHKSETNSTCLTSQVKNYYSTQTTCTEAAQSAVQASQAVARPAVHAVQYALHMPKAIRDRVGLTRAVVMPAVIAA